MLVDLERIGWGVDANALLAILVSDKKLLNMLFSSGFDENNIYPFDFTLFNIFSRTGFLIKGIH